MDCKNLDYIAKQAMHTKNLETALKKAEAREAEQAAQIDKLTKDLAKEKEVAGGLILADKHLQRERTQHLETKNAAKVNLANERTRAGLIVSEYMVLIRRLDVEREDLRRGQRLLETEMKTFQAKSLALEAAWLGYESAKDVIKEDRAELTADQKDVEHGKDMLKLVQGKLAKVRAELEDGRKALEAERRRTDADVSIMRKQLSDQFEEHVEQLRKRLGDKAQQELEEREIAIRDTEQELEQRNVAVHDREQEVERKTEELGDWEQELDEWEERLYEMEERLDGEEEERLDGEEEKKSDEDNYDFVDYVQPDW
ncbi:hypothetical protein CTRI78_v003856 [Colletotrichum trifolii]|uniref:Uncharacterized protein n=1 Tax=Colletotrichum trifolii TaxID=5466 RepID=A0A4R8RIE2_COLTR|nr:hypothetical protein CTRI78_v003856 [Colletotrichum trifolii]